MYPLEAQLEYNNDPEIDPIRSTPHQVMYRSSTLSEYKVKVECYDPETDEVWTVELEVKGEGSGELKVRPADQRERSLGTLVAAAHAIYGKPEVRSHEVH